MKMAIKIWLIATMFLCTCVFFPAISQAHTKAYNISIVKWAAKRVGIEPSVALAFAAKESKFVDSAYNPNPKGKGSWEIRESHGLMQLTFALAKKFGAKTLADLYVPWKNALYGCRFIKHLIIKFSEYSLYTIVSIYNLGESRWASGKTATRYVDDWKKFYDMFSASPYGSHPVGELLYKEATP
jgi:soluble lytic murein transglycosylase-like protein